MALLLSSFVRKANQFFLISSIIFSLNTNIYGKTKKFHYTNYFKAQARLSGEIAKAKTRIILFSSSFQDSDITNSLALSSYRQVQVKIIVLKNKANSLSDLLVAKKSNMEVKLIKVNPFPPNRTILIVDQRVLHTNFALSYEFNKKQANFIVYKPREEKIRKYIKKLDVSNKPLSNISLKYKNYPNNFSSRFVKLDKQTHEKNRNFKKYKISKKLPSQPIWIKNKKKERVNLEDKEIIFIISLYKHMLFMH